MQNPKTQLTKPLKHVQLVCFLKKLFCKVNPPIKAKQIKQRKGK
ncbi:hypothetical Protein psc5_03440 [Candidatus Phytoplasma solani]